MCQVRRSTPFLRLPAIVLFALFLAACGAEPVATRSPAALAATPSPSASLIGTPPASAQPSPGPGGFVTPVPPGAATVWTGLNWRKLAPEDPLARVRSVARWRGGYVALGDLAASDVDAPTPVWTSADGATWNLLGADVFGPQTVVVSVAETADGIVALSLQRDSISCDEDPATNCSWTLKAPLQSWTSSNGTTWTAHPGPDGGASILQAGTDHILVVNIPGALPAISRDGIAWDTVSRDGFPAGWRPVDMVATGLGLVAVGNSAKTSVAVSSVDGRTWTSKSFGSAIGPQSLVSGYAGVIGIALEDLPVGSAKWIWWSSIDGSHWDKLSNYPPLGAWTGQEAQECDNKCPNGILVGNGERMFAYRGHNDHVGWASFDGRSWQPLEFEGSRPTSEPGPSDLTSVIVMPIGVKLHNLDGSIWFGTPVTNG